MTVDRTQGYLAGVDDYISKPFDPDELIARVKNVVKRQERLLTEAARFADADVGQMADGGRTVANFCGANGFFP